MKRALVYLTACYRLTSVSIATRILDSLRIQRNSRSSVKYEGGIERVTMHYMRVLGCERKVKGPALMVLLNERLHPVRGQKRASSCMMQEGLLSGLRSVTLQTVYHVSSSTIVTLNCQLSDYWSLISSLFSMQYIQGNRVWG
jgi:hypothetical protein